MTSVNWEKGPRPSREGPEEVAMEENSVATATEEVVGRWLEILVAMAVDVVEEVVVREQEVATDTQSIAVEHTPEGEVEELETQGEVVPVFVDIDFVPGLRCQFSVLDNAYQGFRLAVLVLYQLFHFYVWTASLVLSKSFCSSALLYLRSKKRAEQTLELFLTEDHYVKMTRLCRFALRRKQKAVNELSLSQRIIGKLASPIKSYLRSNIMAVHNILNSNWIKSKFKWTCSQVTSLSWNETKRYIQILIRFTEPVWCKCRSP